MNFSEYQIEAHATSLNTEIGGDKVIYPALGLANEAGEVLGKLKKIYRDKAGVRGPEEQKMLMGEIGDALWYLSELATQLGLSLDCIARENIAKLKSRKNRGTIQGSGDVR